MAGYRGGGTTPAYLTWVNIQVSCARLMYLSHLLHRNPVHWLGYADI